MGMGLRTFAMMVLAFAAVIAAPFSNSAFIGASATAAPKATFNPQIEGTYSVQGVNPNGTRYSGRVFITVKNNTAFFRWEIAGQTFHGQGPLTGQKLVIDWGEAQPVIYQINADGTLFGTWSGGRASETLRRIN
ncbi:fibronectin-binding protein [Roseibium denhamense]|uniref:Fibronectin-binding protein n=1 Tax=Roseibium denhamense TaxID=76305 RepID=A0ABY1PNE7_9HYPH|nr:fibronectin-binding protein [Roseibium denhamense]MTI04255.1 fibronectin-binding protein [Roseibium denhamense]SMP37308.1 hypothetical protein SAMN06265374_0053 [Roseibium denhamense]